MAKHNWGEYRIRFLKSKYMSVQSFVKEELWLEMNSHIRNQMKGWKVDKQEIIQQAKIQAQEDFKNELVKSYRPNEEEVSEIYKNIIFTIKAKAKSNAQKIKTLPDWTILIPPDINMSEQKTMWEILKWEMWEPTKFNDKGDFIPDVDEEEENVIFYLPNNWRELWQGK